MVSPAEYIKASPSSSSGRKPMEHNPNSFDSPSKYKD